jgi:tetratricopeptide (TPR) repeat protein
MRSLAATVLLVLSVAVAHAQEVDHARLRSTVSFPTTFFGTGVEFTDRHGWVLKDRDGNLATQLARWSRKQDTPEAEARRLLRLSLVLTEAKAHFLAHLVCGEADRVCSAALATDADNPNLLVLQGQARIWAGHPTEGIDLLRHACQKHPKSALAWVTLGRCLAHDAPRLMLTADGDQQGDLENLQKLVMEKRVPRANADKTREQLAEALVCADHAVALAPQDPEAWFGRAGIRGASSAIRTLADLARGEPVGPFTQWLTPELLDDLKAGAKADPSNAVAVAGAAYFDWMLFNIDPNRPGPRTTGAEAVKAMPAASQEFLRFAREELHKVTASKNTRAAAEAHELLAFLDLMIYANLQDIEQHCRKAIELDPTRGPAWSMLAGALQAQGRLDEAIEAGRRRLLHDDSAEGHYNMAFLVCQLDDWAQAEDQVRAALKLDPKFAPAMMGLAACLLHRSDAPAVLAEVTELLKEVGRQPSEACKPELRASGMQLFGLRLALDGHADEGHKYLEAAWKADPGDTLKLCGAYLTSGHTVDAAKLRAVLPLPVVPGEPTMRFVGGRPLVSTDMLPDDEVSRLTAAADDPALAERFAELGETWELRNRGDKADAAHARAARLLQQRLAARPDDRELARATALQLAAAGQAKEAEALLDRALAAAPNDADTWLAMSWAWIERAQHEGITARNPTRPTPTSGEDAVSFALRNQLDEQVMDKLRACYRKARSCADKAAELAPAEGAVYLRRAAARILEQCMDVAARIRQGEKVDVDAGTFGDAGLADLRQAASLMPDDFRVVAAALMLDAGHELAARGLDTRNTEGKDHTALLPSALVEQAARALVRMDKMLEILPAPEAVSCAQSLYGVAWTTAGDRKRSEAAFRKVLARFPDHEPAWEALDYMLNAVEDHEALLKLRLERVRRADNATARFWAAKSLARAGDWVEAEKHVRVGLQMDRGHLTCNLLLASLLLRRDLDGRVLREVGMALGRAERAMGPETAAEHKADYLLLGALEMALLGRDAEALAVASRAKQLCPDHSGVQKVLDVLQPR